jgi:hypothetical protein
MREHKALAATAALLLLGGMAFCQPGYADGVELRVYDREHRDYHQWNTDEDGRYRSYLQERHEPYREYRVIGRDHQRAYWKWRHERRDD